MLETLISTDVLIIGGGAAGSFAAIRARELGASVLLVNKGIYGRDGASTWMAGPAFQAALYSPDSPEVHARDVIKIGRFMADQEVVYEYTKLLPGLTRKLEDWGVRFEKYGGRYVMSRMPGESHPRIVSVPKACVFSGTQYRRVLPRQAKRIGVSVLNDTVICELVQKNDVIIGAVALDTRRGIPVFIRAKAVVLATGGFMGFYPRTMVPMATGDGVAMAYRAGVEVADMEMADFYTYVAVWPPPARDEEWPAILVYDLNAKMLNSLGEEYMNRYTGSKRVPPRAAAAEIRAGRTGPHGGVFMSIRHLPLNLVDAYFDSLGHQRFLETLTEHGFDLRNNALEIIPAAITSFGGCKIDSKCRTSISGLYAAGEVSSGHQGAYVMVGNMVGASCATGHIAGEQAAAFAGSRKSVDVDSNSLDQSVREITSIWERPRNGCRPCDVKRAVKNILNQHAYLVGRSEAAMREGLEKLADVEANLLPKMYISDENRHLCTEWIQALEAVNGADIARLILTSAIERTESRGVHYRDDYPDESHDWLKRIVIRKADGKPSLRHEAVTFPHVKPPERIRP
jgi:succinate dehydrogenase/fumarate reductase flavoprotein subunit